MADSYPAADVGTSPRFTREPNWVSNPKTNLDFVRDLLSFRGTSHGITGLTDDAPITFEAKYTLYTRADYNTLLGEFVAARGRCNRFWVAHPYRSFKLKTAAGNGDSLIYCYYNYFDKQYQGYERLYIRMSTGDIVARKITAATYNEAQSRLELTLNTALDRDVTLTNHTIIGRYLLARFDSDELPIMSETDTVCEVDLSFRELVTEYALA